MKKYSIYYNDDVNEITKQYEANTLEECEKWLSEALKGVTPVDDDHNCTDAVFYSAKTFYLMVFDVEMGEGSILEHDPVITTGYYYSEDWKG